jgi:hypothetical protein
MISHWATLDAHKELARLTMELLLAGRVAIEVADRPGGCRCGQPSPQRTH